MAVGMVFIQFFVSISNMFDFHATYVGNELFE